MIALYRASEPSRRDLPSSVAGTPEPPSTADENAEGESDSDVDEAGEGAAQ
jgi:hypothetical protein